MCLEKTYQVLIFSEHFLTSLKQGNPVPVYVDQQNTVKVVNTHSQTSNLLCKKFIHLMSKQQVVVKKVR